MEDSHVLSTVLTCFNALEIVFVSSLKVPECVEILLNCMENVENQKKKIMDLIESTQTIQIKGESHLKDLQGSVYFIIAKLINTKKKLKKKRRKKCLLEKCLMDAINKIVSLEQKTDKQEQYSRWNCVLVYGFPENNTENSDDVVISTIFEHLIILIFE